MNQGGGDMGALVKNELNLSLRKKGIRVLFAISILILVLWIGTTYHGASQKLYLGASYEETGLNLLEPNRIFSYYMFNLTTSIYIFPFIFLGMILVGSDLKNKIYLNICSVTKNRNKYILVKIITTLIINLLFLITILLLSITISILLPNIRDKSLTDLFSLYKIFSFLIFWLGLSGLSIGSMGLTYFFKSNVAGASLAIYILLERIYTSASAISLQNPILMKINEYLPWCNFNTLFVYASKLKYLTSSLSHEELLNEASVLNMFRIIEYHNTHVAYPFFKDLRLIIIICSLYIIVFLLLFATGFKKRIKEG